MNALPPLTTTICLETEMAGNKRRALTLERLREALDYSPGTGEFRWRFRAPSQPYHEVWNGRWGGRKAGTVNKEGYVQIGIHSCTHLAHHLAWLWCYGRFPDTELDHRNRKRDDNRIANLQEVSDAENQHNRSISKANKSGVTGVSWCNTGHSWRARVQQGGRKINIGNFDDVDEAASAVVAWRKAHQSNFNGGMA